VSKLGCHVVQGPRNGFGDFLSRIRGANQLLTLIKCVDDFGAAYEAKQHNSITIMIGRLNGIYDENGNWRDLQAFEPRDWPSAQAAADAYFSLVRARWSLNSWIDVWETFNEFSAHWAWQADFYVRMMELAEANGHTLALYACSTGNPPRPADDGGAAYAAILSACRRAQVGGHFLALHEYGLSGTLRGTQPDLALRYRGLATYLLERDAMIPLIISEAGQNAGYQFIGTQSFIDDFAWYDSELMRDAYVVGAAAWTLGKWEEANFQEALPALAEYIIAHPTPAPLTMERRRAILIHPQTYRRERFAGLAIDYKHTATVHPDEAFTAPPGIKRETWIVNTPDWEYDITAVAREQYADADVAAMDLTPDSFEEWLKANAVGDWPLRAPIGWDEPQPPAPPPPPPPPPPIDHFLWWGLGTAESGDFIPADWECFRLATALDGVKLMTNSPVVETTRAFIDGRGPGRRFEPEGILVRLYCTPATAPHQTGRQVFEDHREVVRQLLSIGVRWFELHNEPNIVKEGFGSVHWLSAREFVDRWYTPLAQGFRAEFPAARLVFPGLSPSGDLEVNWFPHIHRAIQAGLVDGVGWHSYWPSLAEMTQRRNGLHFEMYIEQGFGVPLFGTEVSNNRPDDPDAEKGRQYRRYFELLRGYPTIAGVYVFALRWSDDANREGWVRNGAVTEIARQVV